MKYLRFISKTIGQTFSALALTLLLPLNSTLAQGTWTQKSDMPFFKNHHSAVAYNGKIYLLGGGADLSACTNEVWEYDPVAGSFTAKAPMPMGLCGTAAVVAFDKIYAFGGYTVFGGGVTSQAFEYNVANDAWKTVDSMPTARGYAAGVNTGGWTPFPFVIGGGLEGGLNSTPVVEYYWPLDTPAWSPFINLPFGRGALTAHHRGGAIFVFGGSANPSTPALSSVYLLTSEEEVATMPTARTLHSSNQIGYKVFLMGGMNPGLPVFSSVDMFDMENYGWAPAVSPMLTARRAFGSGVVDGKIYVFGGNNESGVLKSVEVFDPGDLVAASEPFTASGAKLLQNTPNPFGDETVISFSIAQSAQVELAVFDLNGRKRTMLVNQFLSPGMYTHRFHAGDLETGFYYYRLLLDGFKPEVRKMAIVK